MAPTRYKPLNPFSWLSVLASQPSPIYPSFTSPYSSRDVLARETVHKSGKKKPRRLASRAFVLRHHGEKRVLRVHDVFHVVFIVGIEFFQCGDLVRTIRIYWCNSHFLLPF